MRIRATDEVAAAVRERGGRLYVWTSSHRCCTGPLVLLETASEPPKDGAREFRAHEAGGYQVLLDMGGRRLPDELVLELQGRRRKVVAFWNDQAWVG
ncbi:MAG TPA: hypothetical protein VIK03_03235 [Thermoleophilia bacterium]